MTEVIVRNCGEVAKGIERQVNNQEIEAKSLYSSSHKHQLNSGIEKAGKAHFISFEETLP